MKCSRCGKDFPERFLESMFAEGNYILVDPECALAIKNEVHGTNDTEFFGTYAQQLLEDFQEWKAKQ